MFTGIVRGEIELKKLSSIDTALRLQFSVPRSILDTETPRLGASYSINGVCLSLENFSVEGSDFYSFIFFVSEETLRLTTLGQLKIGAKVNIEPSLKWGNEIGGHFVLGHVDATAEVVSIQNNLESIKLSLRVSGEPFKSVAPFLAPKGSITINGVSLTINEVNDFSGYTEWAHLLIPETLKRTNLSSIQKSSLVNIEVDSLARYQRRFSDFLEKIIKEEATQVAIREQITNGI